MKTTVLDNTPIRWFYRAASQESAQWAAGQTGEIRVDVERRRASGRGGTWSTSAATASSRRRRGRCLT
ncbi:TraG/TraD/VirD4 family protein (plasmid) [Klebsiella pneumoniae]|nr:TraM recognition domain-containing protein [Klebsiella pneumoniae]UOV73381.1 TraG/TraD/VirD4 family protein [Klebsiella pneumoniae]